MRMRVGTSGFGYDQWDGGFYPKGLPADERLRFYAERFDAVELNHTFYRMPKREVLRRWAAAATSTPAGARFGFAVKASRRITHEGRLVDEGGALEHLLRQLEALGDACGPILFQTPHYLRKSVPTLAALVARLPPGTRAAFELRHRSWDDPEVHAVLASAGHAWCAAEHEPSERAAATSDAAASNAAAATITATNPSATNPSATNPALVRTAAWGYVRLHAAAYDDASLRAWAERMRDAWEEAWVFFSHEDTGPGLAARMVEIARTMPGLVVADPA